MRDWTDETDRKDATELFCRYLHAPGQQNQIDRGACTVKPGTDPKLLPAIYAYARDIFAREGNYKKEEDFPTGQAPKSAIPMAAEFRVYEELEMHPRDELVTIVLQRPDKPLPTGAAFDPRKYYRCTWTPWTSKHKIAVKAKSVSAGKRVASAKKAKKAKR